ncbi:MAG: hypothetical protein IPL40_03315 [Proteobacteria bacterium]|nr:hypothetical protein [Pseudomonadota bacterium]
MITVTRTTGLVSVVAAAALALAACAQTIAVNRSTIVPGAVGKLTVEKDDSGNAKVKLEVEHLAPSTQLSPPRAAYVVWAQTRDGRAFMLGQLKVDDDYKGVFEGTAPVSQLRLIVSAEDSTAATQPSSQVVLTTDNFEAD